MPKSREEDYKYRNVFLFYDFYGHALASASIRTPALGVMKFFKLCELFYGHALASASTRTPALGVMKLTNCVNCFFWSSLLYTKFVLSMPRSEGDFEINTQFD